MVNWILTGNLQIEGTRITYMKVAIAKCQDSNNESNNKKKKKASNIVSQEEEWLKKWKDWFSFTACQPVWGHFTLWG